MYWNTLFIKYIMILAMLFLEIFITCFVEKRKVKFALIFKFKVFFFFAFSSGASVSV